MSDFRYVGSELDLFAEATNWKTYWSRQLNSFLSGDVLEVGAGIGSNTSFLCNGVTGRWVGLEPDPDLAVQLGESFKNLGREDRFQNVCGTVLTLGEDERFDTIVYIDVLEHIEDDAAELKAAAARLRPRGRIIVLSPAHQWLFTPFDSSIGHFRRYNRSTLKKVSPPDLVLERMFYLDACGTMASAANRLFLKQSMPTRSQIGVWDKWIVPVSKVVDPVLGYSVGKSIIGIWRKPEA
ncbi:class I SAM-dependent methyltransferase [Edaphobacter aggregans]|uniref:class I SAM-dependent methyltransferase n=1 Tax=Edaphobacter aggregans TaxID=570835 RepID=UPI00054E02AC|nr:methyltransferase domain-containing protein [Edaphobacter aggregans]